MPKIKLKQQRGEYSWSGRVYKAGEIILVSNMEAFYLVHQEKVADEVTDEAVAEIKKAEDVKVQEKKESEKIKIALIRLGGMGDSFLLAAHAKAVKQRWPNSNISLYIRDACDLVNDMEGVDRVVVCGNSNWFALVDELKAKGQYDIIIDNRYVTKVIYKSDIKGLEKDKEQTDAAFKPYQHLYDGWIKSCTQIGALGISMFDLFARSTGIKDGEENIVVPLRHEHFKFSQLLEGQKYVTMHNGADLARQTKCWTNAHWAVLVKQLIERGYKVIQLGTKFEDKIDGVMNLCGMTTIYETAALIAKANFHIDSEGGLVHIARGVRTRCIVVLGPTPVGCFGYADNINVVTPLSCKGCWWSTDFWWRECPKGYQTAKCMEAITPDMVMKAVEQMEKLPKVENKLQYDPNDINEKFALELTLNEGHYKAEKHQWERINIMMDAVKGPKVLEVGAGDGYCSLVLKKRGYEVTPTEISEIRLDRMRKEGLNPVKADITKLPFPDESFDTVMCGEVLEHIPNWWEGMKELERVCKKDGVLVLSWPVHPDYDGIKMHTWSIRFSPVKRNNAIDMGVFVMRRINRES